MKKRIFAALVAVSMGPFASHADHLSDRITFAAHLQPAVGVTTNGHGVGAFMLNSTRDTMYFTTSLSSLSSEIIGFHIHNSRTSGSIVHEFDGMVYGNT